jgi:hypothetical protein
VLFRSRPGLLETTYLGLDFGLLQAGCRRIGLPRAWQYQLLRAGWAPRLLRAAVGDADTILCDSAYIPILPGRWEDKHWVLISHNLEHALLAQGSRMERRFVAWMRKVESRAAQRFDEIWTCAGDDRDFFAAHSGHRTLKLPHVGSGVDANRYVVPAGTREQVRAELGIAAHEKLLVFAGSYFGPNLDALSRIQQFATDHRDELKSLGLRLLLLGAMVPTAYRDGPIIATGRVPETAPYFAAADAGLNPVELGSGANAKLFEYITCRLPVISTRFGVRGSQLQKDRDYIELDWNDPLQALRRFAAQSTDHWRRFAEAVWENHWQDCDIREMVRRAAAVTPGLSAESSPPTPVAD